MVRSLLVLALGLSGCLARSFGPPEPGPEQFLFTVVPGAGPGDAANQAVTDMGGAADVEDADHRASVITPLGRVDIYRYTEVNEGETWTCEASLGASSASTGCTDDPNGLGVGDDAPLALSGVGFGNWTTVELRATDEVQSVVATAADGAVYRSNLVDGYALIVYPTRRGQLTVQALDADGSPLGEPIVTDVPLGDRAPVPSVPG